MTALLDIRQGSLSARLRAGRVLVVGVGGLGAPAAWHLAAAGVGTIGLVDGDDVDVSNLQRQILYRTADIGRAKVSAAAARLCTVARAVSIQTFETRVDADNAPGILADFDFVIDATDGITSKYLINDAAVMSGVPFSHAGIVGFHGQLLTVRPRRTACLRCVFPTPPAEGEVPTCQESGILGALAGTIGVLQAAEAVKFLIGEGQLLTDQLLTYDASSGRWRPVRLRRQADCPLCGDSPSIRALAAVDRAEGICT